MEIKAQWPGHFTIHDCTSLSNACLRLAWLPLAHNSMHAVCLLPLVSDFQGTLWMILNDPSMAQGQFLHCVWCATAQLKCQISQMETCKERIFSPSLSFNYRALPDTADSVSSFGSVSCFFVNSAFRSLSRCLDCCQSASIRNVA